MLLSSLSMTAGAKAFPDVSSSASYAQAVDTLSDLGIITGDPNGNFYPNNTITRAEAATMICRLLGMERQAAALTQTSFADVPSTHWAVGYIALASQRGIVSGYGNSRFGPSDPLTYPQILKMLVCAWGYDDAAESRGGWPDGYLSAAEALGITQNASTAATRGNVAQLFYNTLQIDAYAPPKSYRLTDLSYFRKDKNGIVIDSSSYTTDNFNGVHSGVIHSTYQGVSYGGSVEYHLAGQYQTLNGTLYLTKAAKDNANDGNGGWDGSSVSIYGDDQILFTKTGGFHAKMDPIDFSLDVSNVEYLKITISCYYNHSGSKSPLAALGDLTLHTRGSGIDLNAGQ